MKRGQGGEGLVKEYEGGGGIPELRVVGEEEGRGDGKNKGKERGKERRGEKEKRV